jgi:hypothetical protein
VLKLNIELTLGADVNELALAQGLAWLAKAGTLGLVPTTVAERKEVGDIAHAMTRTTMAPAPVQAQPSNGVDHAPAVEASDTDEMTGGDMGEPEKVAAKNDIAEQYRQAEALLHAGATVPVAAAAETVTRRRGRRSNADKAAAIDASIGRAVDEVQPAQQAAPAMQAQPQPAAATAFALPPGMSMPPFQVAPAAPAAVEPSQRQTPAMPPAQAQPALPTNGSAMLYDDFRNQLSAFHKQRPGYPFTFMRRPAWLDGTQKARWLQAESVPEEFRARLITEVQSTIAQVQ